MNDDSQMMLAETQAHGSALAERWSKMPGSRIRGYSKYKKVDFLRGIPEDDRYKRAVLATLMENTLNWMNGLEETVRMYQVGSFEKYIFPIIRAVFANLVSADLVTVQPLTVPTGMVFYFDVLYGSTKGNISQGTRMFDSRTGPDRGHFHFSDEVVEEEAVGTGTAINAGTMAYTPIRSGTVRFTVGTQNVTDDGNGNLVGDVNAGYAAVVGGIAANTINYTTGGFNFQYAAAPAATDPVTVNYEYDMEANANIPEVDLVLTSAPVTARPQKLRARWSIEAQQDLKAYHGIDAEVELTAFMANEIAKELNFKVIRHLMQVAAAGNVEWSRTPPNTAVPWVFHKESFYDTLIQGGNMIFNATQRYLPTWLVAGIDVCNVIETLSKFKPDAGATGGTPAPADVAGVRKIGQLGMFTVYKDPTIPTDEFLIGFKGKSFLSTGYILAPYLGLYTTPTVVLDDFISRKGLAQRTALKVVNSNMYATGRVLP